MRRIMLPAPWLLALLCAACALLLILIFGRGLEDTAFAYAVYPLSAYAFAAAAIRCIPLPGRWRRALHRIPAAHRYLTDLRWKAEVSLRGSLAVTMVFCLYKAIMGWCMRSAWLGALALYYLTLGIARLWLIRSRAKQTEETSVCRVCGWFLLLMTAVLAVVSFHTVCRGEAIRYPGHMVYAAAGFAFYSLIMAIVNLIRYRKLHDRLCIAQSLYALSSALVSIYFLQASLLAAFAADPAGHGIENALTGSCVLLVIMLIALYMILVCGGKSTGIVERNMQKQKNIEKQA